MRAAPARSQSLAARSRVPPTPCPACLPSSCLPTLTGSVIRDHGLIEIQGDAAVPSGDGLAAAGSSGNGALGGRPMAPPAGLLVNVNNRLVRCDLQCCLCSGVCACSVVWQ